MKAYLVDDEADSLEVLALLISKNCPEIELVGRQQNPEKALAEIRSLKPNLCLWTFKCLE